MNSHWPILAAAVLIAMAATLGLWKQNAASMAATPSAPRSAARHAATAPVTAAHAPNAVSVQPVLPQKAGALGTQPVELVPAQPMAWEAPLEQAANPAKSPNPAIAAGQPQPLGNQAQPVQPVQPAAQKPQAAENPNAQPIAPAIARRILEVQGDRKDPRGRIFSDLRTMLQEKTGAAPLELAAGAIAFSSEGARVEIQPPPNWSINIYNVNPKNPEVETEGFKACLATVAMTLGVDTTQKPVVSENGKSYLKSTSKLGSMSLVRDPATGNSCTIRPLQQLNTPKPAGDAGKPAEPAAPKAGDENF